MEESSDDDFGAPDLGSDFSEPQGETNNEPEVSMDLDELAA